MIGRYGLRGIFVAALLLCLPGAAQAAWLKGQSKHFIIYSDGNERELRQLSENLERYDQALRMFTKATGETAAPVRIFLLRSAERVQSVAGHKYIAGVQSVGPSYAYIISSRGGDRVWANPQMILFHEYMHFFMLSHFAVAYPSWYIEGMAELFSTMTFDKNYNPTLGKIPVARAATLASTPLYPLSDLFSDRALALKSREDGGRFYATAWLLTHFKYNNAARSKELDAYLQAVATGKDVGSIDAYFSGGIAGLQKDLEAYKKSGLTLRTYVSPTTTVPMQLSTLPEAEGALLDYEMEGMGHMKDDEAKRFAAEVDKAAAAFPDSAYAWTLRAKANLAADQYDVALADADKALSLEAGYPRGLLAKAEILVARADDSDADRDWEAARLAILAANRADTANPLTYKLFYLYHRKRGMAPTKNAVEGLWSYFELVPQSPDARFMVAQHLAAEKEYARAANILGPIAFDPHGGPMAAQAMEMRKKYLADSERLH